jgi:hypothetical protein
MRPLQYPDFADPYHMLRVFPTEVSDGQRFPAYSGATVPDFHRLPVADVPATLASSPQSPSASQMSLAGAAGPGASRTRVLEIRLKKGRICYF